MNIMVQGTSSGAGKTTLVAALCRIFSDMGYGVAPFKSQNMSRFLYRTDSFAVSYAQAVQAIAARIPITPDLNPILLEPLGDYYSTIYIHGKKHKKMHAKQYYGQFVKSEGLDAAISALSKLEKKYDLIILEGAGSPAEINLPDIANMRMAQAAKAQVLLVADIERGGAFASLAGTLSLVEKKYQKLIKGFIFNKFRGDLEILKPGFSKLRSLTGVPTLGVIPYMSLNLPQEDSLHGTPKKFSWTKSNMKKLDTELDRLANQIKSNLNMNAIQRML